MPIKYKLKKDDPVVVIAGKDKKKVSKIIGLDKEKGQVVVENVNVVKRHTRPNQTNPDGGIIEKNMPFSISNVMYHKTAKKFAIAKNVMKLLIRHRWKDMTELKEKYLKEVVPHMMKTFSYKNINQVPVIEKVVLNMGVGEAAANAKVLEHAINDMTKIAGQKPVVTRAKKSIAGFKIREGQAIGCKVTLRHDVMYEFLQRFFNIALARVRDFKGVSPKSFDGRGNYAMGVKEQIIFPEIDYDKIDKVRGLDVIITTTAKTDEEGRELLKALGMPFA